MATASEQFLRKVYPKPEVLRRNIIEQMDRLPDEGLMVLHDLAQEIELRAAWSEFSKELSSDWAAGKYADLDKALTAARESLRQSNAG